MSRTTHRDGPDEPRSSNMSRTMHRDGPDEPQSSDMSRTIHRDGPDEPRFSLEAYFGTQLIASGQNIFQGIYILYPKSLISTFPNAMKKLLFILCLFSAQTAWLQWYD